MSTDREWELRHNQRLLDNASKRAEDTMKQMIDEMQRPLSYHQFNKECQ